MRIATVIAVAVLAGQLTTTILVEPEADLWVRAMGITAIGVVCGTIAVPILHRISAIPAGDEEPISESLSVICPRCGQPQELPRGRSTCRECALGFRVELSSPCCFATRSHASCTSAAAYAEVLGAAVERFGAGRIVGPAAFKTKTPIVAPGAAPFER